MEDKGQHHAHRRRAGGAVATRDATSRDRVLTDSDSSAPDLWIFEVGPDIESTFVAVSTNGLDWSDVGHISGSTRSIDIDAFGFGIESRFGWLRLVDDSDQGTHVGGSAGADIDAVGAISSLPVPLPPGVVLLGSALMTAGLWRRRHGERQ